MSVISFGSPRLPLPGVPDVHILDLLDPRGGGSKRVAVIGTCRVHDPITAIVRRGDALSLWVNSGVNTHSLGEARQLLDLTAGRLDLPSFLNPLIYVEPDAVPPREGTEKSLLETVDRFIVEMSGAHEIRFRQYFLNGNAFSAHFLAKNGAALLPWYRLVSQGEAASEKVIQDTLGRMNCIDDDERRDVEALLREIRYEEITAATTVAGMRRLTEGHAEKFLFVSHFLVPGASSDAMVDRRRTSDCLKAAATEIGAGFFDPSAAVAEAGRAVALDQGGKDIYHYAPDFNAVVGDRLLVALFGLGERSPSQSNKNRLAEAADAINDALVPFHRERAARHGVDGSGLFDYYRTRLESGRLVQDQDIAVANLLIRFIRPFDRYHVLRAGLGEIAFVLAEMGRETRAFDNDWARHGALAEGARHIAKLRRWPRRRLTVERLDFAPPATRGETICVAVQGAFPVSVAEEDAVLDLIGQYDALLMTPRVFLRVRESKEEQSVLIEKLRARGFSRIVDYPALGLVLCTKKSLDPTREAGF